MPWEEMLELAEGSHLLPLLHDAVTQKGLAVPEDVRATLRLSYLDAAAAAAVRIKELQGVVTSLGEAGVSAILLKGAALAMTVYRNPAPRLMTDVDLLLRRGDFPQAVAVLARLGYRRLGQPGDAPLAFALRWYPELTFSRTTARGWLSLDLHAHLLSGPWTLRASAVDLESLWQAARPLDLAGTPALRLSPEDTLINLCQHAGIHHTYAHVLGLLDIDRTVAALPDLDWQALVDRARAFELRVATYFGLSFANHLLGTPVPEPVWKGLDPGRLRRWAVPRALPPEATVGRAQGTFRRDLHYLVHVLLVDRLRGLLRATWSVLWPSDEWLAARYGLTNPGELRRVRLLQPLRYVRALFRRFSPTPRARPVKPAPPPEGG